MFSFFFLATFGIALCVQPVNAETNDDSLSAADRVGIADEMFVTSKKVLDDTSGAPVGVDGVAVDLPSVAPAPLLEPTSPVAPIDQTTAHTVSAVGLNVNDQLAIEPEVVTAEFAGRVAGTRARLDALIVALAAGEGTATQDAIVAAEAAEKEVAALQSSAGTLAWRADRMTTYWTEIRTRGFPLPEGTIPYEIDRRRPFHERDSSPATTIEISPQLVYATQGKFTYQDFETLAEVPGGAIAAGEKFLYVGVLRTKKARRVLGWVLGRGQIIVIDTDIALLDGE